MPVSILAHTQMCLCFGILLLLTKCFYPSTLLCFQNLFLSCYLKVDVELVFFVFYWFNFSFCCHAFNTVCLYFQILDGIQVSMRNVHIIYIDKQSDCVSCSDVLIFAYFSFPFVCMDLVHCLYSLEAFSYQTFHDGVTSIMMKKKSMVGWPSGQLCGYVFALFCFFLRCSLLMIF